MLVDSHCHIDLEDYDGRVPQILQNMAMNGVTHALCVCINLDNFARVLALAEAYPQLYASVGVHPDQPADDATTSDELVDRARHNKVVAVGETGLDYYRQESDPEWQRERFRTHIRAAKKCRKPLIIHTRDAGDDTLRLMREEGAVEIGGVMHCFTETLAFAEAAMEMGFMISFSGIVTFKNANAIKEVAKRIPLDRLLVETDSPYLAPVPHRGKTNEPAFVVHTAKMLAELKGVTEEELAKVTTGNFFRLFSKVQRPA